MKSKEAGCNWREEQEERKRLEKTERRIHVQREKKNEMMERKKKVSDEE